MNFYEVGSMPPSGYIAWDEWASAQIKGGLKQSQCAGCELWLFPQEVESHKCRRTELAGAATLSGLYNCEVCGEEKCRQPGICDGCLTPPDGMETLTKEEIEMCQIAVGIVTDTRTMTDDNMAKWNMLYEKLEQILQSLPTLPAAVVRVAKQSAQADGAECVCENHTDNDGWRCNVCGLLSPHRQPTDVPTKGVYCLNCEDTIEYNEMKPYRRDDDAVDMLCPGCDLVLVEGE